MPNSQSKEPGLAEARAVADGRLTPAIGEGEAKLLRFFLHHGECTAQISESVISVRYSWLLRVKPSTYFVQLAPGLVAQLMRLGQVRRVAGEAIFHVGPGKTGTGCYVFDFARKWCLIRCEDERILIKVRDYRGDLFDEDPGHYACDIALCERCRGMLRTPRAKQCLHCGFDWH